MAKRVVVTGASSGIGAATVRLFRRAGLGRGGRRPPRATLEALAAETGGRHRSSPTSPTGATWTALRAGRGARRCRRAREQRRRRVRLGDGRGADVDDWRAMFEVNVIGTKRVIAALLPLLRDGARGGGHADIVTVTSIAGYVAYENGGGYNAAKFAEHALVGVLRLELAGEPIRVVEIAPGMVKTDEFALTRFGGDRAKAAAVYDDVAEPLVGRRRRRGDRARGRAAGAREPRPGDDPAGGAGGAAQGDPRRAEPKG